MYKRIVFGIFLLSLPIIASAQDNTAKKWTVTPRFGMTASTITGDEVVGAKDLCNTRVGFGGGVEVEYHFNNILGLSAGAFYTKQGAKVNMESIVATNVNINDFDPDFYDPDVTYAATAAGKGSHFNIDDYTSRYSVVVRSYNPKISLHYINIPVMLNAHIPLRSAFGLTAKAGFQLDWLASANIHYDTQVYIDGDYAKGGSSNGIKDRLKDFGLTIPVGLAFNYKNIELDARYLWNVTDINDADYDDDSGSNHNSTFFLTIGYKFDL